MVVFPHEISTKNNAFFQISQKIWSAEMLTKA